MWLDAQRGHRCYFSTFTRTISSGMLIMAPVNQFSRLLAKLRMAWVKAPDVGGGGRGGGGQRSTALLNTAI